MNFREELHVERSKNQFGEPRPIPSYDWVWTKTNLANNTVQILKFGNWDGIGEICKLIDEFESGEQYVKLGIKSFLAKDSYYSTEEY